MKIRALLLILFLYVCIVLQQRRPGIALFSRLIDVCTHTGSGTPRQRRGASSLSAGEHRENEEMSFTIQLYIDAVLKSKSLEK